jgi:signal transduction histidine kinase
MAKEPKFFWRGVMIMAPVLVLTTFGLYSLKQDRLLAEAQARERAQELAEDFANDIISVLRKEPSDEALAFELDEAGKLVFPPPVTGAPIPTEPGEGSARYKAALLAMQEGRNIEALRLFEIVARDYPDTVGETGLPIQPLAQLKWIELAKSSDLDPRVASVEEVLGSNAVFRPTLLSPQILQRLPDSQWQQLWARHERIRAIHASAREQLAQSPSLLWVGEWLLAREEGASVRYICWHANVLDGKAGQGTFAFTAAIGASDNTWKLSDSSGNPINQKLNAFSDRLPRYFDYTMELADKPIVATNQLLVRVRQNLSKGSGQGWTTASSSVPPPAYGYATRAQNGTEYLKLGIHLISPQMLYERERDRAIMFGLLITLSVVAAVIGCISAWRAFDRQHRLAEMKSDFVSSVSHELRAPIASVRLMAEGLERGSVTESEKQHEYFRFIVQECRRLGSMIENVLDFSRIEQGRKEYQFEPTDLPKLVEQTVKLMEPYAAEREVNLTSAIAPDVGETELDGRAIQQALVNLIDNAIKHSPPGAAVHISASVAGRQVSAVSDLLSLSVQDQGSGIPHGERDRIFERFYRCGPELRRETQGVGIGLSIVKHIVDAHSGTIHVDSEPGKGSTFTLVLPRQQRRELNES